MIELPLEPITFQGNPREYGFNHIVVIPADEGTYITHESAKAKVREYGLRYHSATYYHTKERMLSVYNRYPTPFEVYGQSLMVYV
jgi:hypothetical protein